MTDKERLDRIHEIIGEIGDQTIIAFPDAMDRLKKAGALSGFDQSVWQPIATAEKVVGSLVLLRDRPAYPHVCYWSGSVWRVAWDGSIYPVKQETEWALPPT
jgi:hypothetical protein